MANGAYVVGNKRQAVFLYQLVEAVGEHIAYSVCGTARAGTLNFEQGVITRDAA